MKRILTKLAVLSMVAGVAQANVIVSHVGANSPTSEGFTESFFGSGLISEANVAESSWVINDTDAGGSGSGTMQKWVDDANRADMTANGWKATVNAKAQTDALNKSVQIQIPSDQGTFKLELGKVSGEQIVEVSFYDGLAWIVAGAVTNAVDDYHVTELVYDGNAGGHIDVFIDGTEVFSDLTASYTSGMFTFGSAAWGVGGEGRYKEVTLEAIPEPAALGLVVVMSGAALFVRRHFMI